MLDNLANFIIAAILLVLTVIILVQLQSDIFGLNATEDPVYDEGDMSAVAYESDESSPSSPSMSTHTPSHESEHFTNYDDPQCKEDKPLLSTILQQQGGSPQMPPPGSQGSQGSHNAMQQPSSYNGSSVPEPCSLSNDVADSAAATPPSSSQENHTCAPKSPLLTPSELLPKDANSLWELSAPSVSCGDVTSSSLIQAAKHHGLNTVGTSLRNANLQLRSEPPNPQVAVSPWLNSTISPDLERKSLDGGCP